MLTSSLGTGFAEALAAMDFERVAELLHPDIDFRALTPNRSWEAAGPDQVVSDVLREWLDDSTDVDELQDVQTDRFANCERIGYRFSGRDSDGPFVVEQQAYLEERDGLISWMRVLCSGFRSPT